MKELVFLGAGAAADAGLPTNMEFGSRFADSLSFRRGDYLKDRIIKALGDEARNPENLLNLLATEESGFSGFEGPRRNLKSAFNFQSDYDLSRVLGQALINCLSTQNVEYLRPLVQIALRKGTEDFCIATTNYDNSIESYCRRHNITFGIQAEDIMDMLAVPVKRQIRLIKLRGSVDWLFDPDTGRVVLMSEERSREWGGFGRSIRCMLSENHSPQRINEALKGELTEFKDRLQEADVLTVVGCSFENTYFSTEFFLWVNANAMRKMRIMDPAPGAKVQEFINSVPAERITLMRKTAAQGYFELYAN